MRNDLKRLFGCVEWIYQVNLKHEHEYELLMIQCMSVYQLIDRKFVEMTVNIIKALIADDIWLDFSFKTLTKYT